MINNFFRRFVTILLRAEAKLVLKKYQPKIVGVTGSVGKTGTKDAIATVLAGHYRVRSSYKSFNHEIGVPLTILNCPNAWRNPLGWLRNLLEGLSQTIFRTRYPEWLVLEIGVEQPGDIDRVTAWVNFDIAVITRLPEIPVHVEFFASAEDLSREKLGLARSVRERGTVILNFDDPRIMAERDRIKARIITYGFRPGADLQATEPRVVYVEQDGARLPAGLEFNLVHQGVTRPIHLPQILAYHQIYGALAALGTALAAGLSLEAAIKSLAEWQTPPGRFRLLPGIKQSLIIDDSYNASPAAVEAALGTLGEIQTAGRKIAVLGDMLELGPLTIEAHRQIGTLVPKAVDQLVTVGLRAKFLGETAAKNKKIAKTLKHFDDWRGVGEYLQNLIEPGDVILVKGSQSIRLEKVVVEIMAQPEKRAKLLVRQEPEWQRR